MHYETRTILLANIGHVSIVSNSPESHIKNSKENTKAKMWNTMRSSTDKNVNENGY